MSETFNLAGQEFRSRLIIGTGKYRTFDEMKAAHKASGAEMVTVAVNRVPLDRKTESFLDHLDPSLPKPGAGPSAGGVRSNWMGFEISGISRPPP